MLRFVTAFEVAVLVALLLPARQRLEKPTHFLHIKSPPSQWGGQPRRPGPATYLLGYSSQLCLNFKSSFTAVF